MELAANSVPGTDRWELMITLCESYPNLMGKRHCSMCDETIGPKTASEAALRYRLVSDDVLYGRVRLDEQTFERMISEGLSLGNIDSAGVIDAGSVAICSKEDLPENACPICMEPFKPLDCIYTHDACRNQFHYLCMLMWANGSEEKNSGCPLCRKLLAKEGNPVTRIRRIAQNLGSLIADFRMEGFVLNLDSDPESDPESDPGLD